jgi:hypothetical protein
MRTGDIATPSYTTKDQYIKNAAEEIDAALGHVYVTPFVIDPAPPENRPAILFLKKINWLLASGRMVSDIAAAGEESSLNAYAARMLNEACEMIDLLKSQKYVMVGAELLSSGDDVASVTGPMIFQEDPVSMVQQFYELSNPLTNPFVPRPLYPPVRPYGYPDKQVSSG